MRATIANQIQSNAGSAEEVLSLGQIGIRVGRLKNLEHCGEECGGLLGVDAVEKVGVFDLASVDATYST